VKYEEYSQRVLDVLWEQSEEVEGEQVWTGALSNLVKEVTQGANYSYVTRPLYQSRAIIALEHEGKVYAYHLTRKNFRFHDDGTAVNFDKKDWGKITPAQVQAQREQDLNRRVNRLERQMEQVLAILTAQGIVEAYDEAATEVEEDLRALLMPEEDNDS